MENLNFLKDKGKQTVTNLVQLGKKQPEHVQTWGGTGAAALIGAVALTAGAKGLLGIIGILAAPPVSLTVGAVGGGLLGWSYLQQRKQAATDGESTTVAAESTPNAAMSAEAAI